jgi:hypothetical protein
MATHAVATGIVTTANTNTSTSLTSVANTSGITVGMAVTGAGIPNGTTVSSISGTTVTLSAAATATAAGVQVAFTWSLTAVKHAPANVLAPTDLAAIAQAIKDDVNVSHPTSPGAYTFDGLLFVPNRGVLQVRPGDVVAVDSRGWPILLSADAITNGEWSFV